MILSAYKETVDELNLKDVARDFIHKNDTRISLFGEYKCFDPFLSNVFIKVKNFQTIQFLYGQYYGKHKISYLTRRCGAFQEVNNFILLETY